MRVAEVLMEDLRFTVEARDIIVAKAMQKLDGNEGPVNISSCKVHMAEPSLRKRMKNCIASDLKHCYPGWDEQRSLLNALTN
jgi:hypothetical protein